MIIIVKVKWNSVKVDSKILLWHQSIVSINAIFMVGYVKYRYTHISQITYHFYDSLKELIGLKDGGEKIIEF
jgi:hypothetical protein